MKGLFMIQRIDANEVGQRLRTSKYVLVLEALPEKFFNQGHLPGAINVPHDVSDKKILEILPDRTAEIITYCANRPCANSEILAERLVALGYNNVVDFYDGKEGWVKSGRRLVRSGQPPL